MGFFDDFVDPGSGGFLGGGLGAELLADPVEAGSVSAPEVSAQEQAILDQLSPFIAEQIKQQTDLFPRILAAINQDPSLLDLPEMAGLREVFNLRLQRQKAALGGEQPFDPALERDIAAQRRIGRQELTRQSGTNFLRSTAGGQGFARLGESEIVAREGARRRELASGNQALLGLAGGIGNLAFEDKRLGLAQQGQRVSQLSRLYNPAGVTAQAGALLDPLQSQRLLEFQTQLFNEQNQFNADIFGRQLSAQRTSDILGLAGTIGGAYAGGASQPTPITNINLGGGGGSTGLASPATIRR